MSYNFSTLEELETQLEESKGLVHIATVSDHAAAKKLRKYLEDKLVKVGFTMGLPLTLTTELGVKIYMSANKDGSI